MATVIRRGVERNLDGAAVQSTTRDKFVGDAFAVAERYCDAKGAATPASPCRQTESWYTRCGQSQLTSRLTWFDRSGRQLGTAAEPGVINTTCRSRQTTDTPQSPVLTRRTAIATSGCSTPPPTYDSRVRHSTRVDDDSPTWFPDRQHILFVGQRRGFWAIFQKAIAAATKEEAILTHEGGQRRGLRVSDISADGTLILFQRAPPDQPRQTDLWILRKGEKTPAPYLQTNAVESEATFSPDGKWIAYQSNNPGQPPHVMVEAYPPTGGLFQISRGTGFKPLWRSDGKELFFLTNEGVMAVAIDTANGFHHWRAAAAARRHRIWTRHRRPELRRHA